MKSSASSITIELLASDLPGPIVTSAMPPLSADSTQDG